MAILFVFACIVLYLSTELIFKNDPCKEFQKLTFRAFALRRVRSKKGLTPDTLETL